jgi:hypothetical protein
MLSGGMLIRHSPVDPNIVSDMRLLQTLSHHPFTVAMAFFAMFTLAIGVGIASEAMPLQ